VGEGLDLGKKVEATPAVCTFFGDQLSSMKKLDEGEQPARVLDQPRGGVPMNFRVRFSAVGTFSGIVN
jgi:hypothetical protein